MDVREQTSRRSLLKLMAAGVGAATVGTSVLTDAGPAHAASLQRPRHRRRLYVRAGAKATNNGLSVSSPFPTIQAAADVSEPGDTILVMNGTYWDTESPGRGATVLITRSGAAEAPIRYLAYPGHRPVIRATTATYNAIYLLGASYIEIAGFRVIGNSESLTYEEAFATQDGTNPKFNANGIITRTDPATGVAPHHLTLRHNLVRHWPGAGIAVLDGDYSIITDNTVHSNAWYSIYANSGITIVRPSSFDDYTGYRNNVSRNLVYDNEAFIPWKQIGRISDGDGIIIDSTTALEEETGKRYVGRTYVSNNIAVSNGGGGVLGFSCEFVDMVNNTAYFNSRSPALDYGNISTSYSTSCRLLNNVSVVRPGEPTNSGNRNVDVTYDYNIYYGGLPPAVVGPHDLVVDPQLRNPVESNPTPGNFGLRRSSAAVDSGTTEAAPKTDFRGHRRPRGAGIDRGALESR